MVKKENSVYLFLGQDNSSKHTVLNRLKEKFLPKETEEFNRDILYAKELSLKDLQEKLLFLPLKLGKRIVVIKNAQDLKDEIKDFLGKYVRNPQAQTILVLDIEKIKPRDEFIGQIKRFVQICHFTEERHLDVFALSRQIEFKKAAVSLEILDHLLKNGEKPERILGGLRASWERNTADPAQARKRIKLLLQCDIDIKTGRLKPTFALERLIVNLCGLKNFSG
jgi:DNA polymerase III delta subunit